MQNRGPDEIIGILTVKPNFYDSFLKRIHVFIYDDSELSKRTIRLISNSLTFDGHQVESHQFRREYIPGYRPLSEAHATIVLFPEIYQSTSGLLRLIANVLCDKGKVNARKLLLVKFHDSVVPSYLKFEDDLDLSKDDWMETLRARIGYTTKLVRHGKSKSFGDHLDDVAVDSIDLKWSCKGHYDQPDQHVVTPEEEMFVYMIRGDTSEELATSKQITDLLSIAEGYDCKIFSTSDQRIEFLPQFLRFFTKWQTIVLIFETVYGTRSQASDYGILLHQNSDIVVRTIELCHPEGQRDSVTLTSDRKPNHVRLIGTYRDWYKVILDAVANVVKKTTKKYVGEMSVVDDAAIVVRTKYKARPVRPDILHKTVLPVIITLDDCDNMLLDDTSTSRATSSSRLSPTWQLGLFPPGSRTSLVSGFKLEPFVPQSRRESLASRFKATLDASHGSQESIARRLPTNGVKMIDVGTQTEEGYFIPGNGTDAQYKAMFELFDADGDGSITLDELCDVVQRLGFGWERASIENDMKRVDKDGNGMIELDEFLMMMKSYKVDPAKEIQQMFDVIDKDGDGSITTKEIWTTWKSMGIKCTMEDVGTMIAAADEDHNGVIDFEEFKHLYKNLFSQAGLGTT